MFHVFIVWDKGNKGRDVWGVRRGTGKNAGGGDRARVSHKRTNLWVPASSIFRRFGSALRDEDEENLEGFTVRPLSVLELVTELKREVPSFVMVAGCGDQGAWPEGMSGMSNWAGRWGERAASRRRAERDAEGGGRAWAGWGREMR